VSDFLNQGNNKMQDTKSMNFPRAFLWLGGAAILLAGGGALVVFVLLPLLYPREEETRRPPIDDLRGHEQVPVPKVKFKDITRGSGITFVHNNGSTGKKLLPETMGGGRRHH
jgi:hypothetical protein